MAQGRRTTKSSREMDAISLLKDDHKKVASLLQALESSTPRGASRRAQLVEQIESEVKMHSRLEEEIFYPAFRESVKKKEDRELFHEAREEHHVVDVVLKELRAMSGSEENFGAKAMVLKELIEHHVKE